MKHPREISIKDYSYDLPEEKIASHPLTERDASKLLVNKNDGITQDIYKNLAAHLPGDSLLIFNNTKVVEARLLFQKPSGGQIEIFCLEPDKQYPDVTTALASQERVYWHCLIGGASKWKHGQVLEKKISHGREQITLTATFIEKKSDFFIVELSWFPGNLSFAEILHLSGAIPLPPYIKRQPEKSDTERYQTVYARLDGSVAAPTAGLHFTNTIFNDLGKKGIKTDYVTLHVGAGTFKPVKADRLLDHDMHAEWIEVRIETIESLLENIDKTIVAVGTTSLRTLETLYWLGLKELLQSGKSDTTVLLQWEVYELEKKAVSPAEALTALIKFMTLKKMERLVVKTQILIAPGYKFKIVKGLITNFHQPRSTLLLLIAAFIGDRWKKIYEYALENDFRFLSYGDGCLLWNTIPN